MGIFLEKNDASQKAVKASTLNKRIDKKLAIVAETFEEATECRHDTTLGDLLHKKIFFKHLRYIEYLDLKYRYENRFVSISYNLELSTEVIADKNFEEIGDCSFEIKHKGGLHISDAEWICKEYKGDKERIKDCLNRLNNRLIIERIVALDIPKITLNHKENSLKWTIKCESILGSSTWILIPPVISLIKPKVQECVKFVEFFELVADAVVNNV